MLRKIASIVTPKPTTATPDKSTPTVEEIKYVKTRDLQLDFNKPWLEDETDVNSYIKKMEKALFREINNGKKIQI